jgi:hypothetical protein
MTSGEQRLEVSRRRALADHDPHAEPALLERLLVRRALVVAPHAGREVRVQFAAGQARRVAVDVTTGRGRDLRERVGAAPDDAGNVHHLRDPDGVRLLGEESRDVLGGDGRRSSNGDADARHHHEVVDRDLRGMLQDRPDPVDAEDVRDLVRIGRPWWSPGSAARGELVDHDFVDSMHVAVDGRQQDDPRRRRPRRLRTRATPATCSPQIATSASGPRP